MISFKTDLKKIYYFSIALLVLIVILAYFALYLSLENRIMQKYLPESQTDAVLILKSAVFKDLMTTRLVFFGLSVVIFVLPFIFSLVTYQIYIKLPFTKLRTGLRSVKEGDFETRITVKGLNEVSALFEDFNNMVKACQKKIAIKHYVSNSTEKMVENLNTGEITTQPRRKLVTVFFSDVRGFTSFSEQHDPLVVINTINELFNIQVTTIKKNGGDIDKFIGDEIMVEFPTPSLAFKAAQEIQSKVISYNKKRSHPLQIGIGINYGEAIVGAIGSGDQYNWTMVGNTVNIAKRLCSAAEPGSIIVSAALYEKLKIKRSCAETEIRVKGISKTVKAYIFNCG